MTGDLVLEVSGAMGPGIRWECSMALEAGSRAVVLASKEEVSLALVRLFLGLAALRAGNVRLFGRDLGSGSPSELYEVRRRVGVVFSSGGLVSNLRVWENLVLPLQYHANRPAEEVEQAGLEVLERLRYNGPLSALPAHLTGYQRRLIGLARVILLRPELIIYESPILGLTQDEKRFLLRTARELQEEQPGRASLFVTSSPEAVLDIAAPKVFLM